MGTGFLLYFFNKTVGTSGAVNFDFSAAAGDPYFLSAGRAFEMLIGFMFLKIGFKTYPAAFCLVQKFHKLAVFFLSCGNVF